MGVVRETRRRSKSGEEGQERRKGGGRRWRRGWERIVER